MRAGLLRHRITIQKKTVTRDAVGGEAIVWENFAVSIPASAEPLSGREFVTLRAVQSELSIRFRFRYLPGITPSMRVLWEGNAYDIVDVIDINARRKELQLMCNGPAE